MSEYKDEVEKIIDTAIMAYQNGVDEINEIAFEKAIANKKGVKSITINTKMVKELDKNKKSTIDHAVKKILSLIPEEGEVIAEGILCVDEGDIGIAVAEKIDNGGYHIKFVEI